MKSKYDDEFEYVPIENPCFGCGEENTKDHVCSDYAIKAFYESELILLKSIVERMKQNKDK
jgi:uncharacterized protein YijF (DUF1287 family)